MRIGLKAVRKWVKSKEGKSFLTTLVKIVASSPEKVSKALLHYLALDLAQFLPRRANRACRAILFLDTFEELKRGGLDAAQQLDERERWIHDLWAACHAQNSEGEWKPFLQIVIAGRLSPRWTDSAILPSLAQEIEDLHSLELCPVNGLSQTDASAFLLKCNIGFHSLQQAILRASEDTGTEGAETTYHAFALGLCVDTVFEERAKNNGNDPAPETFALSTGQIQELAERFRSHLAKKEFVRKIDRLSLTPRFDRDALRSLFSGGVDSDEVEVGCERILRFTFVEPVVDMPGWYQMHSLMKKALNAISSKAQSAEWNQIWEDYWQHNSQLPIDDAASLAWFHHWKRSPEEALAVWNRLAERLRQELEMRNHFVILRWWEMTGIETRPPKNEIEARCLISLGVEWSKCTMTTGAETFDRAIAAYRSASEVLTSKRFPQDWAMIQNSLGNALSQKGIRSSGAESISLLAQATDAYSSALLVRTFEEFPKERAETLNNLGNTLWSQGTRTDGEEGIALLDNAIDTFRSALKIRKPEKFPQDWAMTTNNLGNALKDKGTRTDSEKGIALLVQAIEAYNSTLPVRTFKELPLQWAMTKNNLGNALRIQGTRTASTEGTALLAQAIEAYSSALKVRKPGKFPQDWAETQNALGNALQKQGSRIGGADGIALLNNAVDAYRSALGVFSGEHLPQQWAMTKINLGSALREVSILDSANQKSLLSAAIEAHKHALEIFTEDHLPRYHAIATKQLTEDYTIALGGQDRLQALLSEGGPKALQSALEKFFSEQYEK